MDSRAEIVNFLKSVPLFSEVSSDSLKRLSEYLTTESFSKNEVVFNKGDIGDVMYVILEGSVKAHDKSYVYGHLKEFDSFGEFALIDNEVRSATITTTNPTKLLRIGRSHFVNLMRIDLGFAKSILSTFIKKHKELDVIRETLNKTLTNLEDANLKMSGLINGAMDAIIMFDDDFKITLTNPSANYLCENESLIGQNVLPFLDKKSAATIKNLMKAGANLSTFIPEVITIIGSKGMESLNEGTISKQTSVGNSLYTLILRNIEDRLFREDKINLLTTQAEYLEEEIKELTSSYGIISEDASMQTVLNLIDQVAKTDATVLIHGETGTGKELVARAIHKSSNRNDKPLIRINCGAIPENLIESELFGHMKGSFTGANSDRKGRFLLANKGTIFLDEIGELPLNLQPKLLRVIQEGEFDPIGSSETLKVDVRILAATHKDLLKSSTEGQFREDLYYRLNVFPLTVPPLRARGNDIILIAEQMIQQFSEKLNRPVISLTDSDKELFKSYNWPGNVRELQNLIERAVIVSKNGIINWQTIIPITNVGNSDSTPTANIVSILNTEQLQAFEKENILKALKLTKWKISGKAGAAELLGMKPTTLNSKIKVLGIERPI